MLYDWLFLCLGIVQNLELGDCDEACKITIELESPSH